MGWKLLIGLNKVEPSAFVSGAAEAVRQCCEHAGDHLRDLEVYADEDGDRLRVIATFHHAPLDTYSIGDLRRK